MTTALGEKKGRAYEQTVTTRPDGKEKRLENNEETTQPRGLKVEVKRWGTERKKKGGYKRAKSSRREKQGQAGRGKGIRSCWKGDAHSKGRRGWR